MDLAPLRRKVQSGKGKVVEDEGKAWMKKEPFGRELRGLARAFCLLVSAYVMLRWMMILDKVG